MVECTVPSLMLSSHQLQQCPSPPSIAIPLERSPDLSLKYLYLKVMQLGRSSQSQATHASSCICHRPVQPRALVNTKSGLDELRPRWTKQLTSIASWYPPDIEVNTAHGQPKCMCELIRPRRCSLHLIVAFGMCKSSSSNDLHESQATPLFVGNRPAD